VHPFNKSTNADVIPTTTPTKHQQHPQHNPSCVRTINKSTAVNVIATSTTPTTLFQQQHHQRRRRYSDTDNTIHLVCALEQIPRCGHNCYINNGKDGLCRNFYLNTPD
jgi:hypothetical protein